MRSGFSLVELLVAIVILTVGVLALAAAAGMVAAHLADGGRLTASAHATRSVIDSLTRLPCDAITGGRVATSGVDLTWTVVRDSSAAGVDLAVASPVRRGTRADTYQSLVPCTRE